MLFYKTKERCDCQGSQWEYKSGPLVHTPLTFIALCPVIAKLSVPLSLDWDKETFLVPLNIPNV